jgi:hypothetical protein
VFPTPQDKSQEWKTYVRSIRALAVVTLAGAFLYMVVHTTHWPLMQDAPVTHYVNFMADHGFAPYRDIGDMNMPGAYLMERLSVVVFGPDDRGFRVYDLFLMGTLVLAMIAIAWPYDWLAGLFAGILFALNHASDGPKGAGQRDEVMVVLMVVGLAFLFHSVRKLRPAWMAPGCFFFGMAATVKPTAVPFGLLLLLMIAVVLRRRGERIFPFMTFGTLGGAGPAILLVGFLLYYHSLHDFLYLNRNVTTYYAGLDRMPFIDLLRESLPRPMRLLVPFGIAVALMNPDRRNWERWALVLGVAFGAFSYFMQGKGFYYQRYPLIAMTLLWFGIEFAVAAQRKGAARVLGTAGLAIGTFALVPLFAARARTVFFSNIFTETLEADLEQLGVDRLQRNVQCLDMVDGCINALYHLEIVQRTGLPGDTLLFPANPSLPVVQHYRQQFWDSLVVRPPDVFVISDEKFLDPPSFDKLNRWPQFEHFLGGNYDLLTAHNFPISVAYRIYVRKGSFADSQGFKSAGLTEAPQSLLKCSNLYPCTKISQ